MINRNNNKDLLSELGGEWSGWEFEFVSNELKNNKEAVLAAINIHVEVIRFVSDELKNDKEVVLAAVKKNNLSIKHASQEIQDQVAGISKENLASALTAIICKEHLNNALTDKPHRKIKIFKL
jgi:hypothetical protein